MTIQIEKLKFANIMSYGNYVTEMSFNNKMGPILIQAPNGSGKTNFITTILWCLFGRTIKKDRPGDSIINNVTKANCYVTITTKDGWEITRSRKRTGHNELQILKNNIDITPSTTTAAQQFILDTFNLNYDLFTTSIFFGQRGKSLLEMSDGKRKEALEKLLNLEKLNKWASTAHDIENIVDIEVKTQRGKLEILTGMVRTTIEDIKYEEHMSIEFDEERKTNLANLKNKLKYEIETFTKISTLLTDVNSIEKQWDNIEQLKLTKNLLIDKKNLAIIECNQLDSEITLIESINTENVDLGETIKLNKNYDNYMQKIEIFNTQEATLNAKLGILNPSAPQKEIEKWKAKKGNICPTCKQKVAPSHIENIIKSIKKTLDDIVAEKSQLNNKLQKLKKPMPPSRPMSIEQATRIIESRSKLRNIEEVKKILKTIKGQCQKIDAKIEIIDDTILNNKPSISIKDIANIKTKLEISMAHQNQFEERLKELASTINPYKKRIKKLKEKSKENQEQLHMLTKNINKLNKKQNHAHYLYRAYRERNKIKSMLLNEQIPILNNRIAYYLDAFGHNLELKFTSALSIDMGDKDYKLCSGGEEKRIDLAIMFALYDLYVAIYGQQCNVLILDEPDPDLDIEGIEALSKIIHNDFDIFQNKSKRLIPDTIIMISHKSEMASYFQQKIKIEKKNDFSYLISKIKRETKINKD